MQMPWPQLSYGSDVTELALHPHRNHISIMFFCWSSRRTQTEWMNQCCWICSSALSVSSGWTPRQRSFPVSTPFVAAVSKASLAHVESCAAQSAGRWWSVPWMNSLATSSLSASWMVSSNDLERPDLEQESAQTVLLELWLDHTALEPETRAPLEHSPRELRRRAPLSAWVHTLCEHESLFLIVKANKQNRNDLCVVSISSAILEYLG